jgi:putative PEP-CTERM system histidine kinase
MDAVIDIVALGLFVTGAIATMVMAAASYPRRERLGAAGQPMIAALTLSSVWLVMVPAIGGPHPGSAIMLSLTYLAWLWMLYRLFANDDRHQNVRPIRPVVLALAFVELMQIALVMASDRFGMWPEASEMIFRLMITFRLLFAVGALVLVHNLFVGASPASRMSLRWPAAALATIWLYDLNLYTITYLVGSFPETITVLRPVAILLSTILLALWTSKQGTELTLRPSRSVTFQSISLIVIGAYLVGMVLLAQGLAYVGGDFGRLMQVGFVVIATAVALMILPSKRLRGWLNVTFAKHLFQHRYDYRVEWMRFTQTIGQGGKNLLALEERAVQALADITDSSRGLLFTPNDEGSFSLESRWQWPDLEIPAEGLPQLVESLLVKDNYILDLDDVREGTEERFSAEVLPEWLLNTQQAWALVPLVHYNRLVGLVVLSRPSIARKLDWEDFDLLRVVGQQIASYLAEQEGQEALIEAQRFDEFNRRIAFVMHDIKNLASQLSLLARNAEKHADKPEFRADMLVTLRNSADKLNALLARLGRYGNSGGAGVQSINLAECVGNIVARFESRHQVMMVESHHCMVMAEREAFEQALVHLIQNAVDASDVTSPVYVNVIGEGAYGKVEVVDSGAGMSAEFVRKRLFKPFHSSKSGGFGIGAFEARELIRAMGGRLDVESREGLGTRFQIVLPLSVVAQAADDFNSGEKSGDSEVA